MKKFILCLIMISFALPSNAWFWNKKDKALEAELQGKGYAGTLPNLNKGVKPKEEKATKPIYESQTDFTRPSDLKPVPKDNPAFINIISKRDVKSEYIVDANEIIPLIERLADTIENEANVQLFVTRANVLTMNIDHLIKKYDGKPESYYESFKKLLEINTSIKTIAQLRREAITYQRYLAYQSTGSIYNPQNINQQLEYLLEELNATIFMLKQESNI